MKEKSLSKRGPEYFARKVREYAHRNKEKIRARAKAIYDKDKTKHLIRAKTRYENEKTGICLDCKIKKKTEFHHLSYKPNLFVEVCKKCHLKRRGAIVHGEKLT